MVIMGLAVLVYVVLDGYDLGVGMLLGLAGPASCEKRSLGNSPKATLKGRQILRVSNQAPAM